MHGYEINASIAIEFHAVIQREMHDCMHGGSCTQFELQPLTIGFLNPMGNLGF